MKPRLLYFLSHPIQYFSPLLRKMNDRFDLKVYYYSQPPSHDKGFNKTVEWDTDVLGGYEYCYLKNLSGSKSISNRLWNAINPDAIGIIRKDPAKVVIINGWSYFSDLLVMIAAAMYGKQVWCRADNALNLEMKKSALLRFIKAILLRLVIFKFIDKFLYTGQESKGFFEYYGAKESQLVFTPHAVDNEFFQSESHDREALKDNLFIKYHQGSEWITHKKVVLFVGKFIPEKQPMEIVHAFKVVKQDAALVMVGGGPLKDKIEWALHDLKMDNNVKLFGFANQSEISKFYSIADALVLYSASDTWGLVVNEAMNFGLPVIVSANCGCAADLVDGNGFIVMTRDELTLALEKLLGDDDFRTKAGLRSKEIIKKYSIEAIVDNIEEELMKGATQVVSSL